MTFATSLQLRALLAIPAALRSVLLSTIASSRSWPQCTPLRQFTASCRHYGSAKYPNVAALAIPEFRTSPLVDVPPDDLFKNLSLFSAPGQPLDEELVKLYTQNPAAFIYAESDFYKLKKNTRVPEVCVLGRSNVGKSSFVNALARRPNNGLAFVSSKAGKTRSINAYGFGPAPTIAELQAQGNKYKDEDIPTHLFHLVDMPGYGHASMKEWGDNISLYMRKRNALRGAVLLIDAEVGPKDSDYHLLQLLSRAELKTAIVLTKADKVKKGLKGLRETCQRVWDGIHAIEARTLEGNWVWERDVYVTAVGARDSAVVKSTMTTARLAVARLAGLIKDERPKMGKNHRWSGKVVSFDDLLYAPSTKSDVHEATGKASESTQPARETSPPINKPNLNTLNSGFTDLERAAQTQHGGRSQSRHNSAHAHVRKFHGSAIQTSDSPNGKPTGAELKAIIDEFVKTLKTDTPRDEVRRLWQERERHPRRFFGSTFEKIARRQAIRLQRRYPEQAARTRGIFLRRLKIEERRRQIRAAQEAEAKPPVRRKAAPETQDTMIQQNTTHAWDLSGQSGSREDVEQSESASEAEQESFDKHKAAYKKQKARR
ncbi:hypothetical protein GGS21DRAFT_540621 [Xylaria nigripes]|nr:hypothetical protein GGS21DRAFT_540621 [Xylaria nigripes]